MHAEGNVFDLGGAHTCGGEGAMVSTCMLGRAYSASVGPSEALIRCNQRSSEVIRGHQRSSEREREREPIDGTKAPLGGAPGRRALTHRLS